MSVEFYRESPGKFDSRTLNRTTLNRWTGRNHPSRKSQPRGEAVRVPRADASRGGAMIIYYVVLLLIIIIIISSSSSSTYTYVYMYVCVYIYIYIYILIVMCI